MMSPVLDPECEVTVRDASGKAWTMTVRARSLFRAVIAYNAEQVCGAHREYPKLKPGTDIEVRLPDGRILHTTGARWRAWSNRESERQLAKLQRRRAS